MVSDNSTLDRRKQIARRIPEEIASEGAIDIVDELFAEGVVAQISPLGEAHGRDEFRKLPQRMRGAFPDLEATIDEIVAEGDHVAMRVTLVGTHQGQFMGVEPTGESFKIEHTIFVRFDGDEIVKLRGQLDAFALQRQLGVLDHPTG
jgi:predicted ester cyclase